MNMSENRGGRKKHMVEGTVSEIKRSQRGIGRKVGEMAGNALTAFRRLLKVEEEKK